MALLTVEEVAQRLKIKPIVVRRWLRDGILTGAKLGRIWRIEEKDLENFIEKAKTKK